MLRTRRERTFFVLAAGAVTLLLFAWNGHSGIAAPLDLLDPYPHPKSSEGDTRAPLKLGHSVQHGHHPHQPVPTPSPAATAPVEPLIANYDGDATPPDVPMPDQHLSSDDFTAPIHPPAASMVPPEPAGSAPPSIAVLTVYVPPRLTLIVLWSPQMREHNYLPNFFASVGANPSIDVLLIKFDKYRLGGDECTKPRAGAAPNVREVCVDMDEYWDLHLEYLCGHWGCNAEQRTRAREVIVKRTGADRVNSFYRPFRAEVFKKYMLPDVKLWAWADLDVVLGNFERIFPWDVASQFDVLIAGWPTNWEHILLYMPGHMTVFRNDPDVAAAFLHLHFLETLDAFVGDDFLSEACEEGEYSHELFMRSGLTFLRFDAMVDAQHHISTLDGVFAIEGDGLSESTILSSAPQISAALREHSANASPRSTFTSEGREELVNVVNDGSRAPFLWFGPQYAVMYESVLTRELGGAGARAMRRYTIRRERGGPVSERAEPEEGSVAMAGAEGSADNRLWLREALYNHLQAEKYKPWWALPERPVGDGEVLYIDKEHGAHLWNADGNVLWESARAEEHI